jgi:uncharacterized protein (TIGR02466 family)
MPPEGAGPMGTIEQVFVTSIYRGELSGPGSRKLLRDLDQACRVLAEDDEAGQAWCGANSYPGYTSYASLTDLPDRFPPFADLAVHLDQHAKSFARQIGLDLGQKSLRLDSVWVNVLPEGGYHTSHLHPHSVISGTMYVAVPKGSAAIKFEDPRLGLMMAHPPRTKNAKRPFQTFVTLEPKAGTILMWESFLRHEVPVNAAGDERISISFNYAWD